MEKIPIVIIEDDIAPKIIDNPIIVSSPEISNPTSNSILVPVRQNISHKNPLQILENTILEESDSSDSSVNGTEDVEKTDDTSTAMSGSCMGFSFTCSRIRKKKSNKKMKSPETKTRNLKK